MKRCKQCNISYVKDDFNFCQKCGNKLITIHESTKNSSIKYFNIKANCSICNKNLDLFGLKSRFMLKDGWLCNSCFKKIGRDKLKFNKTTIEECKEMLKEKEDTNKSANNLLYTTTFHVSGISYREENLLKVLRNGTKVGEINKFEGLSRKERIQTCQEFGISIGEYTNESIDVKFNCTQFNGKDAIEVLANDYNNNYILIGYVPKEKIRELITYLDKKVLIWATIVGGKQVYFNEDEEDNIEELNLGVELLVKIFDY